MNLRQLKSLFFLLLAATALNGCGKPIYSTEYNLDFEYAKNDSVPKQWIVKNPTVTGYSAYLDRHVKQHGQASLRVQWDTLAMLNFGGFQNSFPAALVAGKEMEVSVRIKTQSLSDDGSACICLGEKFKSGISRLRMDTLDAVRGTTDWTRFTTKKRIGDSTVFVVVAGIVSGRGIAWFDNMEIRLDGKKYKDRKIPALKTVLTDKDKQQLRKYVYPLRTYEPDGGATHDLEKLGELVEGSKVVGLGECTHGTDEIYKMKHRIVRYLAENDGFDIFSIEANMPESYRMNDYTIGGKGDPKQLIRNMKVWPWMTEEMSDMVAWMKTYNALEPKITFTGIDMQFPATILGHLQKLVETCPSASRQTREIAEKFEHVTTASYRINTELAAQIDADLARLAAGEDVVDFCEEQRTYIQQDIDMLRQFLAKGVLTDWRDRGMAANVQWIMQQHPNSKILLWAHDLHIGRNEMFPMGAFLKEHLGDEYRTFGFACYEGSYMAWGNSLKPFDLPVPAPGTLEYVLGQLGEPTFILDLKKMREENVPALRWIDDLEYREIGSTPEILYMRRISETFDFLVFIRNASASRILNF